MFVGSAYVAYFLQLELSTDILLNGATNELLQFVKNIDRSEYYA